ncbi:hypothetical protein K474DRAFT_1262397 [Panus rudis PR-1116 ss-1]|nr:hypothetical protein K474DRAFT_1262397 [Panus rudis PR-1116 ss-1]
MKFAPTYTAARHTFLRPSPSSSSTIQLLSFRSWRRASTTSTSANPYPYPAHSNPTPHQIFHLPQNASKEDIKQRYYDLVRIYHPDSPLSRTLPPSQAQARFQSISAAYDALRGKRLLPNGETVTSTGNPANDFHNLSSALWRAKQRERRRRGAELGVGRGIDERWKDRLFVGAVLLTIAAFVAQTYSTRYKVLASASAREDPFILTRPTSHSHSRQPNRTESLDDSAALAAPEEPQPATDSNASPTSL